MTRFYAALVRQGANQKGWFKPLNIFDTILFRPMGYILNLFCMAFQGNFAVSIFLFTVLVNAVLIPLSIKQQKSMAGQARIKNKLDRLKEKYKDDKQRFNEEMGNLYQNAGVNPMSGCLLMLIRLPFLIGIYNSVLRPLSLIMGMDSGLINQAKQLLFDGKLVSGVKDIAQITELQVIHNIDKIADKAPEIAEAAGTINFNLFGLDLTQTPRFTFNFMDAQWIWLIPLLSFATALISGLISNRIQKKMNPDAPSMGFMMLLIPIFSLVIAFGVPGAVGFYWACSNVVSTVIQLWVQHMYTPAKVIARLEAASMRKRRAEEQAKIQKIRTAAEQSE